MEISEGYRHSRKLVTMLCALTAAWSAAQFDLGVVNFGSIGSVDITHASIPLLLSIALLYALIRSVIEYAMQSQDIREWSLARSDFMLSVWLLRGSILLLAASQVERSPNALVFVIVGIIVFLTLAYMLQRFGTLALMPIMIHIREKEGRRNLASRAIESFYFAKFYSFLIFVSSIIFTGLLFYFNSSIRSFFSINLTGISILLITISSLVVVVSFYTEERWSELLFYPSCPIDMECENQEYHESDNA
jgi:hypothetical protein